MMKNKDFLIDVENLDVEWALLPQIYSEYCEQVEYVECEIRRLKIVCEHREAEISKEIRQNNKIYCTDYKISQVTEGFIRTMVISDIDYRRNQKKIIALERDRRLLTAAVKSLEMKRDALKNLTGLFQAEYFSLTGIKEKMSQLERTREKFEKRNVKEEVRKRFSENMKKEREKEEENA